MSENLCKRDGGITECTACRDKDKQTSCTHYEKASRCDRCMYLVFDTICDSLKAQRDRYG